MNDGDGRSSGDHITGTVSGSVSGQVAIGKGIRQEQTIGATQAVGEDELEQLRQAFAEIAARLEAEVPAEERDRALERLSELQEAVVTDKPDVTTMAYVRSWFTKRLPRVAGLITGLLVHPTVGRLVEAAGDVVAAEFRDRLGAS
jgi:hypothetical protein